MYLEAQHMDGNMPTLNGNCDTILTESITVIHLIIKAIMFEHTFVKSTAG